MFNYFRSRNFINKGKVIIYIFTIFLFGGMFMFSAFAGGYNENKEEDNVITNSDLNINVNQTGNKSLIVYFSRAGEQYNVGVIDKGNTAIVAEVIAELTGADLFEVVPFLDNYPKTYSELTDMARKEQNANVRPKYAGELHDLNECDVIYVGAPVWWGDWPMIMYTVFENNDFAGKTLIPFSTHEGSGLSGFDRKLKAACPDSVIKKGLAVVKVSLFFYSY